MVTRYAELLLRLRWFVVILTFLLIGFAASGVKNFSLDNNYRAFFDKSNPQLEAFEAMQDNFDKSDNVLIILTPSDGDVFTAQNLSTIEWVTDEAWQTPYSKRVDSLTNFQHTIAVDDDLEVAPLVTNAEDFSSEELTYVQQVAFAEPMLVRRLVSSDGKVAAVNITVNLPDSSLDAVPEIATFVRNLKQKIIDRDPNMEVRLTGVVMMNNAFGEASQNDMATLVPVMFLTVLVVLGFLLRSISATIATLLVIVMSIVGAMGLFFWSGRAMTPPMASAPTIILTMAVADAVHLLSNFLWGMRHGIEKKQAMIESLRINFQPIFLTSLTTVLGFMSMNFSEVPPLAHLGNTTALGVAIAFVLSVSFLPAFVYILPCKVKPAKANEHHPALEATSLFIIKNSRKLLWSISLITVFFVAFIPQNEINDEFVKYFDPTVDFRADSDYASEYLIGPYTLEYAFHSGEENGISQPQFLQKVQSFVDYLKTNDKVSHVYTMTDTMKRLNKNLHGDDQSWYKLPENRELAAQYLLLYEMSLPYGLDLNNQLDIAKSATRVVVSTSNLSSNQVLRLEQEWSDWLQQNIAEYEVSAASPNLMFAHIGQRNAHSLLSGAIIALVLISLILIFALRSLKLGLLSLIPNLVPVGIAFGIWGLIDGQVGMSLSVVAGMTLGIVVDDTVHFLSKYIRAYREKDYTSAQAITYAFTHVGQALTITTLVLVAGFLVLTLSTFKMNADMGLLTAITITIALIIDFLLLPPLLLMLDEKRQGSNHEKSSTNSKPVEPATV